MVQPDGSWFFFAWHAFEMFRPGVAAGTVGGPFHLFLLDVFEYATGLSEDESKLTYWLKHVCKTEREYWALERRNFALRRELDALHPSKTNERAALIHQLVAVNKRKFELWPSRWPFSCPNPLPGMKPARTPATN